MHGKHNALIDSTRYTYMRIGTNAQLVYKILTYIILLIRAILEECSHCTYTISKKGSRMECKLQGNYISLMMLAGKDVAKVLNELERVNIRARVKVMDEQGGFRNCVDEIFAVREIACGDYDRDRQMCRTT